MHPDHLTEHVIGRSYDVYNKLGHGFLERVYQNALVHLLRLDGLTVQPNKPVRVYWEPGVEIGHYEIDVLVEDFLVLELKTVEAIHHRHFLQTLNYLMATGLPIGLILNFGPSGVKIKRVVNDYKEGAVPYQR